MVARWEGVFDAGRATRVLAGDLPYRDDEYDREQIVLPEEQAALGGVPTHA